MEENRHVSRTCPHCGAPLPGEASFCPHCAQSLRQRKSLLPPARRWRKVLRRTLIPVLVLLLAGGGAAWYVLSRPQVYDAVGELYYTDQEGSYHLFLTATGKKSIPMPEVELVAAVGEAYRGPVLLYINHAETEEDAGEEFLAKVERVTAEFPTREGGGGNFACTAPAPHSAFPDVPLISLMDYSVESDCTAQIVWTFAMENGDTIRLRQEISVAAARTYDYYPADAPMGTSEELQALVDRLSESLGPDDILNLHLPAVTYQGELIVRSHPVNLYGSAEGDQRTTFAGPIRYEAGADSQISYIQEIIFQGDGSGTALSADARVWVENCAFTGWDTGVLCGGESWGNVIGCTFEGNGVGFRFDSVGDSAAHSLYNDNVFRNNGTAVLLEEVPTDITLDFRGSRFAGNGTDIENLCRQPLDLTQAVFS